MLGLKWERRRRDLVYLLLFAAVVLVAAFLYERGARVRLLPEAIATDLVSLAGYTAASFVRMLASYTLSLFFAVICGTMAATSPSRERIILPFLDIMQSIPVLGFFPAAVYFFVRMTHGSRLGVEMAAIFLIFTCQAWNMAFGVYEGISTIPADAREVVTSFGCGKWRTFLRLLLPSAVPKLIYNSILSWAGGWYFLIACEIIALGPARYRLPGLGSYLIRTTEEGNLAGTFAGLAVLTLVVLAMDLLIWGPLSAWAGRFRYEFATEASQQETRLPLVFVGGAAVARWIRRFSRPVTRRVRLFRIRLSPLVPEKRLRAGEEDLLARHPQRHADRFLLASGAAGPLRGSEGGPRPCPRPRAALAGGVAENSSLPPPVVSPADGRLRPFPGLDHSHGAVGGGEPAGVAHRDAPGGGNRRLTSRHRPFPLIIVVVIRTSGGMNLASVLLALTGMQWYLLFNLIAGVRSIPSELKEAARSLGLSRWMTWRKVDLPALLPSLITGSLTAWGGGWNSLIVSEYLVYKEQVYSVRGIGSLLDQATYVTGNQQVILLTLVAMVGTIILLNRFVWHRLYALAADRYRIEG